MLQRLAKGLFAVLALLAVSAALASPICDAFELSGDVHEGECCASLNGETPLPPVAGPASLKPPVFAPVPVAWRPDWRAVTPAAAALPPDCLPLTRSYYARSARILI